MKLTVSVENKRDQDVLEILTLCKKNQILKENIIRNNFNIHKFLFEIILIDF